MILAAFSVHLIIARYYRAPLEDFVKDIKIDPHVADYTQMNPTKVLEFQPIADVIGALSETAFNKLNKAQELTSYYRSLFEPSLYGIAVSGPDFKFLEVNDAFCRLTEYSKRELIDNLGIGDVTHPDDIPASLKKVEKLISGELKEFSIERRY